MFERKRQFNGHDVKFIINRNGVWICMSDVVDAIDWTLPLEDVPEDDRMKVFRHDGLAGEIYVTIMGFRLATDYGKNGKDHAELAAMNQWLDDRLDEFFGDECLLDLTRLSVRICELEEFRDKATAWIKRFQQTKLFRQTDFYVEEMKKKEDAE